MKAILNWLLTTYRCINVLCKILCVLSRIEIMQASMDPGNMGPLGEWLPEAIWPKLKSLERIKRFQNIGDAMQSDSDDWQVTTIALVQVQPGDNTLHVAE